MLDVVKIGRSVRALREHQFMTQDQLAIAAGINRDTLSRIERNQVEPRFSTIMKLARTLDVDPHELVDED
jgi:DNA-binding XRE family transcriptional regulator